MMLAEPGFQGLLVFIFVSRHYHYAVTLMNSMPVPPLLTWMLMTTMKRGSAEIRERMRTQDPRFAPSTELAAKDDGKLAFSPPRMLSSKAPLFPEERKGRWRPPEEHREPRPPAACRGGLEEAPQPLLQRRVGRGTASGRSQEDAQSLLQLATCTILGYIAIHNDQTEYIDYTGEEHDCPTSGLTANLNKISTKLFIVMDLFAKDSSAHPRRVSVTS